LNKKKTHIDKMSPHAVPDISELRRRAIFKAFSVTDNAFLPQSPPSTKLTNPYYQPWEQIATNLPNLISSGKLHDQVSKMPVLTTSRLVDEPEWRRAYVILGFMAHAHVWGGTTPHDILPPQITIPYLSVSRLLELPPVLTYAAANLWNFTSTNPEGDFTDLSSLETLVSFTGTRSEAWFLLISVAMEARGADIITTMLSALEALKTRDYQVITSALEDLSTCIDSVGELLERMYEECDPMTFYYLIRPFLAGSKNMEAAGLPNGVFYDEGEGEGEWRQLRGGSNGQSSLIQFFDVVLGVDHKGNGTSAKDEEKQDSIPSDEKAFHAQVREYMPGPHSRFLIHVATMGSIRELAALPARASEQKRLREAYTRATDSLAEFRNKHIRIVTRYIILPSRKTKPSFLNLPEGMDGEKKKKNLASSSDEVKSLEELTGTGGTALIPFLKQTRDETKRAGFLR
jgi:indoleamine 2,3-dioxygenase